ncbi:hypothetical protein tinsulaeT_20790 [Thalassotalea insulae]|uniref:Secreted protein n=1 Tax=Thalassotalea insulae TaxID=2056778 RepID=A0ABQ6GTS3_9GAMM|nr:hypothetical protein [Thalassotalea insulae]GLX78739.1 hypothetical protein tinsulaeT_20790 [Thalassotalea insulae]
MCSYFLICDLRNYRKLSLSCFLLSLCFNAFADGNLTKLKVDSDVVYFASDEAKQHGIPACVASASEQEWAVSLNTATGKAMYSLLVTASTGNRKITVVSANDCADAVGFERAKSVEISPPQQQSSSKLFLYKSDGTTLLGEFKGIFDYKYAYIPLGEQQLKLERQWTNTAVYYTTNDCTGTPYSRNEGAVGRNSSVNNGQFFISKSWDYSIYTKSVRNGNADCLAYVNSSFTGYKLDFTYQNPFCGDYDCIIKIGN